MAPWNRRQAALAPHLVDRRHVVFQARLLQLHHQVLVHGNRVLAHQRKPAGWVAERHLLGVDGASITDSLQRVADKSPLARGTNLGSC